MKAGEMWTLEELASSLTRGGTPVNEIREHFNIQHEHGHSSLRQAVQHHLLHKVSALTFNNSRTQASIDTHFGIGMPNVPSRDSVTTKKGKYKVTIEYALSNVVPIEKLVHKLATGANDADFIKAEFCISEEEPSVDKDAIRNKLLQRVSTLGARLTRQQRDNHLGVKLDNVSWTTQTRDNIHAIQTAFVRNPERQHMLLQLREAEVDEFLDADANEKIRHYFGLSQEQDFEEYPPLTGSKTKRKKWLKDLLEIQIYKFHPITVDEVRGLMRHALPHHIDSKKNVGEYLHLKMPSPPAKKVDHHSRVQTIICQASALLNRQEPQLLSDIVHAIRHAYKEDLRNGRMLLPVPITDWRVDNNVKVGSRQWRDLHANEQREALLTLLQNYGCEVVARAFPAILKKPSEFYWLANFKLKDYPARGTPEADIRQFLTSQVKLECTGAEGEMQSNDLHEILERIEKARYQDIRRANQQADILGFPLLTYPAADAPVKKIKQHLTAAARTRFGMSAAENLAYKQITTLTRDDIVDDDGKIALATYAVKQRIRNRVLCLGDDNLHNMPKCKTLKEVQEFLKNAVSSIFTPLDKVILFQEPWKELDELTKEQRQRQAILRKIQKAKDLSEENLRKAIIDVDRPWQTETTFARLIHLRIVRASKSLQALASLTYELGYMAFTPATPMETTCNNLHRLASSWQTTEQFEQHKQKLEDTIRHWRDENNAAVKAQLQKNVDSMFLSTDSEWDMDVIHAMRRPHDVPNDESATFDDLPKWMPKYFCELCKFKTDDEEQWNNHVDARHGGFEWYNSRLSYFNLQKHPIVHGQQARALIHQARDWVRSIRLLDCMFCAGRHIITQDEDDNEMQQHCWNDLPNPQAVQQLLDPENYPVKTVPLPELQRSSIRVLGKGLILVHTQWAPTQWHSLDESGKGMCVLNTNGKFWSCKSCWKSINRKAPKLGYFMLPNGQFGGRCLETLLEGGITMAESILCRLAYNATTRWMLTKKSATYLGQAGSSLARGHGQMAGSQGSTIFFQKPQVVPATVKMHTDPEDATKVVRTLPSDDLPEQLQVQICGPSPVDTAAANAEELRSQAWKKIPVLTVRVANYTRLIEILVRTNPCYEGCVVSGDLKDGVPPDVEHCLQEFSDSDAEEVLRIIIIPNHHSISLHNRLQTEVVRFVLTGNRSETRTGYARRS